MPIYGRDSVPLLLRRQADFDTAETAGSGKFVSLPCYRNTVGSRRDTYEDKVLGDGRNPGEVFLGFETADGDLEVPLMSESIGWHLYALLGAPVTTGASAPYTHVFSSGGAMSFHTLGRRAGGVQFVDVGQVWNEMRLSVARASETQRVTFGLLGRNEVKAGAVLDAAPVAPASDVRLFAFSAAALIDGTAVADIVDAELTVSNGRSHDQEAVSGNPWPLRILEGDLAATGRLRFRFESAARYDAARAAGSFDLRFVWENGAHSLTLDVANCKFSADRVPLDGGGALTLTLPLRAGKPDSGQPSVKATLLNARAAYANPVV